MEETWIDGKPKYKYKGRVFSVRAGKVSLDDSTIAQREVVEHPGGVSIVPIIDDSVILIRQFRISIEREILELPAGRLEDKEAPESCAHRELKEEIGYRAAQMVRLASYYSSAGFTNERMYIFLAFQLQKTEQNPEWDERIQKVRIPIAQIESKLAAKEFEDAKTIVGLRELLAYLQKHPEIIQRK